MLLRTLLNYFLEREIQQVEQSRLADKGRRASPAVATSLSFAFRAGNEKNLVLFGLAVGITAMLVVIERFTLWLLARYSNQRSCNGPIRAKLSGSAK